MNLFSQIWLKLKEVLNRMTGSRTIEQKLHVAPVISTQMEHAISLWTDMYKDKAPWLHEPDYANKVRVTSLGLPAMIASEKARMAVLELQSEITTPTEEVEVENPDYQEPEPDVFGNIIPSTQKPTMIEDRPISDTARAEYMESQYKKLKDNIRRQLEYGIAKGGLVIKPYVVINNTPVKPSNSQNNGVKTNNPINNTPTNKNGLNEQNTLLDADIEFDFIQADNFYPLAFDNSGKITEAAFIQTKTEKDTIYRRLEYHKWYNNTVDVINMAFKSTNNTNNGDMSGVDLGQEIPLKEVAEWANLQPKTTIQNVDKPLFAYFKMPDANTVDMNSPLGVSGYSRAVNLIKDADMQYSRMLWEYEAGEMAIDIDRDALSFETDSKGNTHSVMPMSQQRLFRKVDLGESNTYQPYAPALRDTSYREGLNAILMRIEDVCAISRGTLSDATSEAKTATELKILRQRSYSANAEIQKALERCLRDVVYIMNVYCDLYEITAPGEYDVSFEWDDSIIVDVDTELNKRLTLMQNGLCGKVENRMWYFGETERQALEALAKIDEENAQAMEQNLVEQSNMASIGVQAKAKQDEIKNKAKQAQSNKKE